MTGKVESGQLCTVDPITDTININDIVLCKVNGNQYLHDFYSRKPMTLVMGGMRPKKIN
jgi:hypothetical protein